jgi:hypothetical protein
MYIKIINENHKWFGQYFLVHNHGKVFYCYFTDEIFTFFDPLNIEEVTKNHEQKRAYWKWKRFKTTYLMHKEIKGSVFEIDKFGTPNIKYKDYSICFFNDTRKWGIFINNTKINLINESDLRQWLTTI